jgi:hypothetical protein
MKFLCVSGGLVDSPSDDILYEVQMHESMQTIGPLDMQIGFTVEKRGMMAVVLHPLPGNVRDSMPKIDVSDQAFQHGLWIRGGIFPWSDTLSSSTLSTLHDLRILAPTSKPPTILTSLGNVLLMAAGKVVVGKLAITECDPGLPSIPDLSCDVSIPPFGKLSPPAVAAAMPAVPAPMPAALPISAPVIDAPPISVNLANAVEAAITTHSVADKPPGPLKKPIVKKSLPRVPHVKRSIGKVTVADLANAQWHVRQDLFQGRSRDACHGFLREGCAG